MTYQVFSPEITFGHLSREKSTKTLINLNTCFSALESISQGFTIHMQDHTLAAQNPSLFNVYQRANNLCERFMSKVSTLARSFENYLKSSTILWQETKGFVIEQMNAVRDWLKVFPWKELDDLLLRISDDPLKQDSSSCDRMAKTMRTVLEQVNAHVV